MTTGRIPSIEGGIQPTIVDAKGDLITATAADTPARLAVGSNGDTLVADSAATTGLRWSGTLSASNPVINGAFDIWQRGTSFSNPSSVASAYGADRWNFWRPSGFTTGITMSRQTTSDTTNLANIQYCSRVQRTASNTSTLQLYLAQNFETINSIPFAGKTVTLSYYARAGANFSAASSILSAEITTGTGTDQQIINGMTGQTIAFTGNATLTTTWQRFSITGTIPTTATQIVPLFQYSPVGTAGAADFFEITGVQIDVGSVALPFRRNSGTIQGELAACQRYYYRVQTGTGLQLGLGAAINTNVVQSTVYFPVTMRGTPTIDQATGTNYYAWNLAGATATFNSFTADSLTTTLGSFYATPTATKFNFAPFATNNASAYFAFSAEL